MLNESRTFSERTQFVSRPTIFLSHKHYDEKDKEHEDVRGIIKLLEDAGGKVYIDSMDEKMPDKTSGHTAQRIKDVIKNCNKFILFATNEAIESFWCNWELGIGDTYKYMDNIAVLPMKDSGAIDTKYKGNEYLQIYPRIDYEDGTKMYRNSRQIISRGYYSCKPRDENGVRIITPLEDWLNNK